MAFCVNCGNELVAGANFCANCGSSIRNNSSPQRKTVYEGELHKCPNCGQSIAAYDTVCRSCGHEIRGRQITSVVHELTCKLENTNDPAKKDELIRTFYIPNTKEDIYEFFILALSHIKIGGMNTNSWMIKLEQAYQKAELSFSESLDFDRLKVLYESAQKMNKKNSALSILKGSGRLFKSGFIWALLFCLIGFPFLLYGISTGNEGIGLVGGGGFIVAAYIALFTFISRDDKKKK